MKTKYAWIVMFILILISLGASGFLSSRLPDTMVSHWNSQGQADGYSSKVTALFLLPGIQIFLALLLSVVPSIDPLKKNIESFRNQYNVFLVCFTAFFTYLHILTLIYNLGAKIEFISWMLPGMGLFFFAVSELVRVAKPNYFIGIRTPWTLSNSIVWDDTHRVGGYLFKVSGIFCVIGAFFPTAAMWFVLVPALSTAFGLFVYSYVRFTQIEKKLD
jgi:uncharacterized membrane protein